MELLGQRWILRVVWELEPGPLRFLDLRHRMDNCSSSVLSERLRQLLAAGVIVKNPTKRWELTTAGAQLGSALTSVWDWAESWAREEMTAREPGASRPRPSGPPMNGRSEPRFERTPAATHIVYG
ncbi:MULTISPECIES: winged helix-turn-helix transcriptional regulator [Mycobacterium]|uniref:winged helix-turn-helix transcriptional regulator n=1 Tax=Mycobacterium TaxID=1763 RepID=UPI0009F8D904|nr:MULTISPECIES: helix-turn-helix domain-containing protein [Mycobacterium]MCV7089361.1 helix-turn-helix transcriptional regulator [Mycobacterium interjectum]